MVLTNKVSKIIAEGIYLFIISFFCYTATNKLVNIDSFKTNLIKTTIFSKESSEWFSYLVILLEVIIVLTLFFYKRIGLILFLFTMLAFTLYISFLRFKGLYEVCGCGGVLNGLKYQYHLLINIGLIIGAVFVFFVNENNKVNEK